VLIMKAIKYALSRSLWRLIYGFVLSSPLFFCSAIAQSSNPTPVFVAVVERQHFVDKLEALGSLKANENVELTSTVTELVTRINFEDGQRVVKGDVLVEMDADEELAEQAEEQSRIDEAQRQVNRLKPLIARGAASKSALDERQRELQTARARMKAILSRINKRQITAPFDGVVGLRNISVGSLAQPGTQVTTIDDDSVMKLDFSVPEVFLSTLLAGVKIEATSAAYPEDVFRGEIASVDSRINPVTRAIIVRAHLDNALQKLKPGLLMQIALQKNPRQALVVPEEAVIANGRENSVWLIVEKNAVTVVERRPVSIGVRRDGWVEIRDGLISGQQVVTHGTLRVRPGAEVSVMAVERDNESLTELLQQSTSQGNTP